jgi:hypothetical protein
MCCEFVLVIGIICLVVGLVEGARLISGDIRRPYLYGLAHRTVFETSPRCLSEV